MTKAITIIALTCFLVAGAAVTSILSHTSMEASVAAMPAPVVKSPVANREAKQDRLSVVRYALAAVEPSRTLSEPIRQAYASSSTADVEAAKAVAALPKLAPQQATAASASDNAPVGSVPAPAKPKLAAKPAPQKSYALLSDAQIAGVKERLKLTSDQEYYWPGIENALRGIARKIHAARHTIRTRLRRRSTRTWPSCRSSNRRRCRSCSSCARTRRTRSASSPASSGWRRSPPRSDPFFRQSRTLHRQRFPERALLSGVSSRYKRSRTMRAPIAYFAGAGTVIAAIGLGLGGGFTIANVMSRHQDKLEQTKLEQRMAAKPIPPSAEADQPKQQAEQAKPAVPYVAATNAAINVNAAPAPSQPQTQAPAPQPAETRVANDPPAKPAEPQIAKLKLRRTSRLPHRLTTPMPGIPTKPARARMPMPVRAIPT